MLIELRQLIFHIIIIILFIDCESRTVLPGIRSDEKIDSVPIIR